MTDFGIKGVPLTGDGQDWLAQRARLIEQLPDIFSTVWLSDHLQINGPTKAESWTALTWLAARFPTMRVGTMVLAQGFRNPGLLGVAAATLQHASGGRLILGLGAGWLEEEYRAFNFAYPTPGERVAQLGEAIELIKALWSASPATYEGQWYRLNNAYCNKPEPPIPVMVGTNGPRALKVVARLADWWVWDAPWDVSYRRPYELLRAECEAIGRPLDDITLVSEMSVWMPDDISSFEATYEHSAYPGQSFAVVGPTPSDVIREIETLVDVGVAHIAVNFEDLATFSRFLDDVVPRVRLERDD